MQERNYLCCATDRQTDRGETQLMFTFAWEIWIANVQSVSTVVSHFFSTVYTGWHTVTHYQHLRNLNQPVKAWRDWIFHMWVLPLNSVLVSHVSIDKIWETGETKRKSCASAAYVRVGHPLLSDRHNSSKMLFSPVTLTYRGIGRRLGKYLWETRSHSGSTWGCP